MTIARDIATIADVYDRTGRTTQPIKVRAAESTIRRAIYSGLEGFSRDPKAQGGGLWFGLHPIELVTDK